MDRKTILVAELKTALDTVDLEQAKNVKVVFVTVDHTARITLIDQNGSLRASYGYRTPVEDLVHDLKRLSQEF